MDIKECYAAMGGDYADVQRRLKRDTLIKKLLLMFPRDENYQLLCTSVKDKSWEEAFRAAHSLKGVCLNLGLAKMANISSDLTEELRHGEPESDLQPLLDQLSELYNRTLSVIAQLP